MENLKQKAEKIKIIFFDIDDTLRVKNTGFMPDSIHRVFETLRQKGIMTGIATGRNFYGIVPEVRALNPDFFVTANGSYVVDQTEQVLYNHPLDKALVKEIISWLKAEQVDYVFYGRDQVIASDWHDLIAEAITKVYGRLKVEPEYHLTHDVYQILTMSERDDQLVLPEKLASQIRMVRWHPHSSDIVSLAGSKADGVSRVLDKLNLNPENVMNFGDELNDLELFELGGLSVAMKVSHPKILARADYVTDTVENDGIEKALKRLGIL
ncbi:MAG: Cof-type HAD-IIB family hydrolase [Streptococcaceae bacterium]|jgi:Cof subfamily protein (haloacid dehalogenase superfamily)|nr:Cof-type HAD-IIB family hydrolase [Streptococcaceae bacterium]